MFWATDRSDNDFFNSLAPSRQLISASDSRKLSRLEGPGLLAPAFLSATASFFCRVLVLRRHGGLLVSEGLA